jgi:hypothetical protein
MNNRSRNDTVKENLKYSVTKPASATLYAIYHTSTDPGLYPGLPDEKPDVVHLGRDI